MMPYLIWRTRRCYLLSCQKIKTYGKQSLEGKRQRSK